MVDRESYIYIGINQTHFHLVRDKAGNGWRCRLCGEVMKEHPSSNRGTLNSGVKGDSLKRGTISSSVCKQREDKIVWLFSTAEAP